MPLNIPEWLDRFMPRPRDPIPVARRPEAPRSVNENLQVVEAINRDLQRQQDRTRDDRDFGQRMTLAQAAQGTRFIRVDGVTTTSMPPIPEPTWAPAPLDITPQGEEMFRPDLQELVDECAVTSTERQTLTNFTARQVDMMMLRAENYIKATGEIPEVIDSIRIWINEEWGAPYGERLAGVVYRMAIRKRKEDAKPKPPFLKQTFKQALGSRIKSVKGEVGIEIEVEGANLFNSPVEWWTAVADGSLRAYKGSHPPIEYVLREPVGRKDVEPALRYLSDRLRSNKSEIVMSHRCSVHVHLNIQQMKMQSLLNFMCLYYIFEDVLMEHAAPERRGNLFCLRAKDASLQIENLVHAIQSGQWSQMMQNEYRYSAMNPAAMSEHGSLEFRAMKGTVDIAVIKDWVTILLALKDSSSKFLNPASISKIFKSLGEKEFLYHVFDGRIPPEILKRWAQDKLTKERINEGYQAVRDVLFAVDWASPPEHMAASAAKPQKAIYGEDEPEVGRGRDFDEDRDDD